MLSLTRINGIKYRRDFRIYLLSAHALSHPLATNKEIDDNNLCSSPDVGHLYRYAIYINNGTVMQRLENTEMNDKD